MKTLFTSDLHFGHENIISMDKRPFVSVDEMNEELIRRWNGKVEPDDTVYILGDMFWKSYTDNAPNIIKRLNGQKILIKGNHDTFISNRVAAGLLSDIKDYADITVTLSNGAKQRCILSHYFIPFYSGHRYNAIHLHGHTHRKKEYYEEQSIIDELRKKDYSLSVYNVGCMFWNYEPVTLDEILKSDGKI